MRSQSAYLVVMMVMMACFSVFRLNPRQLVLLPGNLVMAGGLLVGAAAVAMQRPFSLAVGLGSAALTAGLGFVALTTSPSGSRYLSLPGYPLIWVVIGLYIAFRLVINHQYSQRQRRIQRGGQGPGSGPDSGTGGAAPGALSSDEA